MKVFQSPLTVTYLQRLSIGDVITSREFIQGKIYGVVQIWVGEGQITTVRETADDPSRGNAWFVVEELKSSDYPDMKKENPNCPVLYFIARRLKGKKYDPKGEEIAFAISNTTDHRIKHVNVVANMDMRFI